MPSVVVVGASLPGMAAAARLAKLGHEVTLIEATETLGARWADAARWGATLAVPAVWRDLFRKSGRTLDAELAACGTSLVAAPAPLYRYGRREVAWPTDRATQAAVARTHLGPAAANAWASSLDDAMAAWQILRHHGAEDDAPLTRDAWRALRPRRTLARTIADLGPAGFLAAPLGWGHDPRRVPAWVLTRPALDRSLGRWHIDDASPALLIDLLARRLTTRGVTLRLGETAAACTATTVRTDAGEITAAAVIDATHPWSGISRAPRLLPAASPRIDVTAAGDDDGIPVIDVDAQTIRFPLNGAEVTVTYTDLRPDPGAGAAWAGARAWRQRLVGRDRDGVFRANAASPAGPEPWAQALTGAVVTYAVHEALTGESVRPADDPRRA